MSTTSPPMNPNINTVNGPVAVGANATAVMIESLYLQGRFSDLFAAGVKHLTEHHYDWARQAFELYLMGSETDESLHDAPRRAQAFIYFAIATFGHARPDLRRTQEIHDIARYLVSGQSDVLAPVLAAMLLEDTNAGGIGHDVTLQQLAESASVAMLSADHVRFLAEHLAPCAGEIWQQLRERAAREGVVVPEFERVRETAPADPVRLDQVPKYFMPEPTAPKPVSKTSALVMLCIGLGFLVTSCISGLAGAATNSASSAGSTGNSSTAFAGVCIAVVLFGGAVGFFIAGATAYGRYRTYHVLFARYQQEWYAGQPKPRDKDMERWLQEDVGRIEALGAARHRLNRNVLANGGSLLVEPQSIVGLSSRSGRARRTVTSPDASSPTGFRFATVDVDVPVARFLFDHDGVLRADNYRVLTIYLTADRVCVFDVELELATRRLLQEKKLAFRYRDIVAIVSSTVPASPERSERIREQLNLFLGGEYLAEIQAIEDERFYLSIVDGDKVELNIGIGLSLRGYTQAGHSITGNEEVLRTVERQVWERSEREHR